MGIRGTALGFFSIKRGKTHSITNARGELSPVLIAAFNHRGKQIFFAAHVIESSSHAKGYARYSGKLAEQNGAVYSFKNVAIGKSRAARCRLFSNDG